MLWATLSPRHARKVIMTLKLPRKLTLVAQFILDECLPPIIRDSRGFCQLIFFLMFGKQAYLFLDFKSKAPMLTDEEFAEWNAASIPLLLDRPTDLNIECIQQIHKQIVGETVLDVGCGRGFLAEQLSDRYEVTAVDLVARTSNSMVKFVQAFIEDLPFPDAAYDTVICAHTLEHVKDISKAMAELRRVCARRLILVVPKQRPFRYTFDLHLNFFPYEHSFLMAIAAPRSSRIWIEGGDLFYIESGQKAVASQF
jgi:SAM-dependent methyltransferase